MFSNVDDLKKTGLDVPQPTQLIYELNKAGFNLNPFILTADECADEICRAFYKKDI